MNRSYTVKRLLGIDNDLVGVQNNREHDVHECTVCGARFETMSITCPECESNLFRTKTVVPNALFTLLVIMTLAGLGVAYNVLTGDVPKG
jgi:DNA-directed RNA polymerase subunit RPC12/RpoP